jgi:uncharacterized membrane protein YbhN (UPF0104 family)
VSGLAHRSVWMTAARIAASVALLWIVFTVVDLSTVLARLASMHLGWVAAALVITVLQVALLAWRWRFTAALLGIELPLRVALAEYYLGILLNQLLPGGVAGDVSRAWRHARTDVPAGPAVRAVILERLSAQIVMTLVAVLSILTFDWAPVIVRAALAVVVVALVVVAGYRVARPDPVDGVVGRLVDDARRALLAPAVVGPQLVSAAVVVASYILVFVVAARAVGVDTPTMTILPLVAPVLMTMLVPVSVAGWGVREVAAAALWSTAGLTAEDGTAVSVAYGLLVLASSAPGLFVLMRAALADRSRRARPPRA